ncbi:unnamed protein product [Ambrosiozyma monospora]|uniref:Unnamed protein product n=1 Tax=Ambrosiozyma monospora TaxID=43982 RepID=A0ACB5TLP6_AMBMO|nr:unnamed protein product [Ambrosiozyma monospora]
MSKVHKHHRSTSTAQPTTSAVATSGSTSSKIVKIPSQTESLQSFVFEELLLKGSNSDVSIKAFDQEYKLHSIFISRNQVLKDLIEYQPAAAVTLPQPTSEQQQQHPGTQNAEGTRAVSGNEKSLSRPASQLFRHVLIFEDPYITQTSFELCLKRLYFNADLEAERKMPLEMIAAANYLGMTNVINESIALVKCNTSMQTLARTLMFFVRRDVGEPGKKMVDHLITYVVRNGWEAGPDLWDEMPIPVIVKVVGNERFFVPNEYYRAIFIIKLIERRMELAPEKRDERGILMLRDLLNNQVIYNHIAFPKLRELQQYRDLDGEPYIAKDTILQAIWSAIDLRDQIQISKEERLNYSSYFKKLMTC